MHSGRYLSAWTYADVLYQGYFVAFLVLNTIGVPANPGKAACTNSSQTQVDFGTFAGPHFAGILGGVAYRFGTELVPEVVCPPPSSPGVGRWNRPLDQDRPGKQRQWWPERQCPELAGAPEQFRQIWDLPALASVSRGLADTPFLLHGPRC